jgi:NTP pyrophosphatase (non-canonical NTP hydrolase)
MSLNMSEIKQLVQRIVEFREARDWKQFHNPKDLALSLVLESTEVLEHFQWRNGIELKEYIEKNKSEIGEELADVFYWILLMAHDLNIDLVSVFQKKMDANEKKYSVEKAKGNHKKYSELA